MGELEIDSSWIKKQIATGFDEFKKSFRLADYNDLVLIKN